MATCVDCRGITEIGDGDLLIGIDSTHTDGPWQPEGELRKVNGVIKYTHGDAASGFDVEGMAYTAAGARPTRFRCVPYKTGRSIASASSIPPTAARRIATACPATGGATSVRAGSSARPRASTTGSICSRTSRMPRSRRTATSSSSSTTARSLGTDVTYSQPLDPVRQGRQAHARASRSSRRHFAGRASTSRGPRAIETVREDEVKQTSYSAYLSQSLHVDGVVAHRCRRAHREFRFEVSSGLAANSGTANDHIVSPKFTAVFGPWDKTEVFLELGAGLHGNEARGSTITVDPVDGSRQ